MKKKIIYIFVGLTILLTFLSHRTFAQQKQKSVAVDTTGSLIFPFNDEGEFQYPDQVPDQPLYLGRPSNVEQKVMYDPETQQYIIYDKVGEMYYRLPKSMSLSEFVKYDFDRSVKEYWRTRSETEDIEVEQTGLIPQLKIESQAFNNIFGSDIIDIRLQGYVEVQFGLESNFIDNELISENLRRVTTFDFENQINLSVAGKIGDKVEMNFNYNTEATFDFENQMKLNYTGSEDEILRSIEAGNVSLPLNGTLIQGATNLFGVKTEMQFGKLNVTTVISQNKGESSVVETDGGAQSSEFEIMASDYDENRHFFISKYFYDNYNASLSQLPLILSSVVVSSLEVWVTNTNQNYTSSRDIVAFVDLGETDQNISNTVSAFSGNGSNLPDNDANKLYSELVTNYSGIRNTSTVTKTLSPLETYGFENGTDWEKVGQARKLSSSEYTFNTQLGFISLNSSLNSDEVLAVAFQYTYGGQVYQVGELTSSSVDSDDALIVKLIKGTSLSPDLPTWDLMMKNVYNLNAYDLSETDFDFSVVYKDDSTNSYINYLPDGELRDTVLLRLMNLDNLNSQGDYVSGGNGAFDFIDGVTIKQSTGRVIFPVLEPFGANISDNLSNATYKEKYAFTSIYDSTKTKAEADFTHDKFAMIGSYQGSSSSEIVLNSYNLAEGSVVVSAGGITLEENIDYVVDYTLGRVTIINDGLIEAGTSITVSTDSEDLISTQRKTLIGNYASYAFSDKFNVGGTMLWMNERSITSKVEIGEEAVSNAMLGLDFQYNDKSQFLTDLVNLLPFYESNTESSISIEGEVAKLITGESSDTGDEVYIDDFEGVETDYSMLSAYGWTLASTPQGQSDLFPEGDLLDDLKYGYNRANFAWYIIDRTVFNTTSSSSMPANIKADVEGLDNHYTRSVLISELYPDKDLDYGTTSYQTVLNLAFYPEEKGPYNFDTDAIAGISAGVDQYNKLKDPESRWGGIMREVSTTNFETANIDYIEFWVMDPYIYDEGTHEGGDLYIDLGSVSEDILKDSRKAFENGLPDSEVVDGVDTTVWGRVSTETQLTTAFENDTESKSYQDVGFDGLSDANENSFFIDYLNKLQNILSPDAYTAVLDDPSNDDFHYYRGSDYDDEEKTVLERYKRYNYPDGNTPSIGDTGESYSTVGKTEPDVEDINGDNTLSEKEAYFQYKVSLRPEDLVVGSNFVVDKVTRTVDLDNSDIKTIHWYQFKIPIKDSENYDKIGSISDFASIRFMRMFMTNFSDSVVLRFGSLNLVRSDWREETASMVESGSIESSNAQFEYTSINIEENGSRSPINYILPPDVEREVDASSTSYIELNEQSMLLKVENLESGDACAVYKDVGLDLRSYEDLQMEVHAEAIDGAPLDDEELSVFIRMGTDEDNYYEYEIPLILTSVPTTSYDGDLLADRLLVWPEENQLDLDLTSFPNLKLERNEAISADGSTISTSDIYEINDTESSDEKNIIRMKGNPSLGEVDIIHIGIRNPKRNGLGSKSIEIWVNELRLSGYEQTSGWASTGSMRLNLADLGSLSLSGSTESVGWGSINDAASERNLENVYSYNIAANAQVGKLLPKKIGLNMPLYYSYSKNVETPEYDPLNSDIKMVDALALIDDAKEKKLYEESVQDIVINKSFNLSNVTIEPIRKNKDRKPLPTDIENFSFTYSKNEESSHSIDVEKYLETTEKGVINYNYSLSSKSYTPLKKINFLKAKPLAIIRDFNFSLLPELISFSTDLTREYTEATARDNSGLSIEMPTSVDKSIVWNRYFDFKYSPTRALSIEFSNQNISYIDELDGVMDKDLDPDEYDLMMEEIYRNLADFGRPVDYNHTVNISYRVPINKLPLLDWTSASASYQGTYNWVASSVLSNSDDEESIEVGNTVDNGMSARLSGQLNFLTLYNKVPYFKKVNSQFKTTQRSYGRRSLQKKTSTKDDKEPKKTKDVKFVDKKVDFRADIPKSIFHRLGTKDVKVTVFNDRGDSVKGEVIIVDANRVNFKSERGLRDCKVVVTGKKEIDELFVEKALAFTTRMMLGVRSARVTYSQTGATVLPGFLPEPYLFGGRNDESTGNSLSPTIPFLLGWQDDNFVSEAFDNGWITHDNTTSKNYLFQSSKTYNFSLTVEPIPNFKINFTGTHRGSSNISSYLNYDDTNELFQLQNSVESGSFSMTISTLKSAFKNKVSDDYKTSTAFDEFRYENLQIIADRLNEKRGWVDGVGYTLNSNDTLQGVSLSSTDVIIPAFLAAYTGIDPNKIPLTARPGLSWIRPNWTVSYNGNPQKIEWMKNFIQSLNFTHSYKSTYTIGSFETNLEYEPDENGLSWNRDETDGVTFIPQMTISSVNIQESLSPLINIDIGFVNDLSTRFEINRTRSLSLNFTANQLNETVKNEYTFGIGYRFTGLDLIVKSRNKSEEVSNDIDLTFDFSSSSYKNTLRSIDDEDGELSGGTKILSFDFSADYMLSDKITVELYYQYSMNNPYTTNSGYTTSTSKFGLSFNFSIL